MKKLLCGFLVGVLAVPFTCMLGACEREEEDESLAGKTICCSEIYEEIDLSSELYFEHREYNEDVLFKIYGATMTYVDLLEFCLGTDAIHYPNGAQPTTLEEAKELFVQKLENKFFDISYNPYVQFSEDLTKAHLLYGVEEISEQVYDVEYVDGGKGGCDTYILKSNGVEIVRFEGMDSGNEKFYVSYQGNPERENDFIKDWCTVALDGECSKEIELSTGGESGEKITKRLDEVFGDENSFSVGTLIYTILN